MREFENETNERMGKIMVPSTTNCTIDSSQCSRHRTAGGVKGGRLAAPQRLLWCGPRRRISWQSKSGAGRIWDRKWRSSECFPRLPVRTQDCIFSFLVVVDTSSTVAKNGLLLPFSGTRSMPIVLPTHIQN